MRLDEIETKVINGELRLEKSYAGKRTKRKYIWDKDTRKIEKVETIVYDLWICRAVYKDGAGYRISKKVYEKLLKELAKKLSTSSLAI